MQIRKGKKRNKPEPGLLSAMIVAAVIGGYVVTSLVLFKFPQLIHRPKKLKFKCRHISHRGGAGENLENTISSYEHAKAHGTQMLEIDLQLTRDGEVVICHDNHLLRPTGVDALVSDTNYKDLPLLRSVLPVDFAGGVPSPCCTDRQIPKLRECFQKFPGLIVNVDIKTNNDELIKKVSDLCKEFDREEITVWGNGSDIVCQKCYIENTRMPLFFSLRRVLILLVLTYTGLLPFVPLKESCLEIPFPSAIQKLLLRRALFEHLRKRGIQTYLWVLNTEEDFRCAYEMGATGVMTDFPSKLEEFLRKNPSLLQGDT